MNLSVMSKQTRPIYNVGGVYLALILFNELWRYECRYVCYKKIGDYYEI